MTKRPSENFDSPSSDDSMNEAVEQLMALITSGDPKDPSRGQHLLIRMSPRVSSDDPRLLELIALLSNQSQDSQDANSEIDCITTIALAPGQVDPCAAQHVVTDVVKRAVSEDLDRQAKAVEEQRSIGSPKAKPVEELVQLRGEFMDACGSMHAFASHLADYCADQLRNGCTWWQDEIPEPLRTVLTTAAGAGAVGSLIAAPMTTVVVGVVVVALVTKRNRKSV
ncbi:MAG: hypothetical protein ACF8MF_12630 [Phycisphaerales bacterium JB052]